jgi:hypothetical protein
MKLKLLFFYSLICVSSYAQYTLIPDEKFEGKLNALGIDSGPADGRVLTSKINKLTTLDVSDRYISDLTGIEDFVALQNLYCQSNQLTTLDLSKNMDLTSLHCYANRLTDLNVSKNIALEYLICYYNQLKTLDVSQNTALINLYCTSNNLIALNVSRNTALTTLYCQLNQLTTLDVSHNTALTSLDCGLNSLATLDVSQNTALKDLHLTSNQVKALDVSKNTALALLHCQLNQLIYLNLKNGSNTKLDSFYSNFRGNPDLSCIQVDDVAYSDINWASVKDDEVSFNTTCKEIDLELTDELSEKIVVYPNPVKGELHLGNSKFEEIRTYNAVGNLVKTKKFIKGSLDKRVDLSGLPKGVYYLYLESEGAIVVKKILVE